MVSSIEDRVTELTQLIKGLDLELLTLGECFNAACDVVNPFESRDTSTAIGHLLEQSTQVLHFIPTSVDAVFAVLFQLTDDVIQSLQEREADIRGVARTIDIYVGSDTAPGVYDGFVMNPSCESLTVLAETVSNQKMKVEEQADRGDIKVQLGQVARIFAEQVVARDIDKGTIINKLRQAKRLLGNLFEVLDQMQETPEADRGDSPGMNRG